MLRIILFLSLFHISSLYSQQEQETIDAIRKFQRLDLTRSIVLSLSGDYYRGRNILDSSITLSQSYIENVLKSQRILSLDTNFTVAFNVSDSFYARNIVGVHYGNKGSKKAILIFANYDNLGVHYMEGEHDMIYNGANDNASGVASLIQIALFFSRIKLKHNVIFAFTSGKRFSMRGSCALATLLETNKLKVTTAFNLEMLGKPIEKNSSNLYIKSPDSSDIHKRFNKLIGSQTFLPYSEDQDFIPCHSENTAIANILKIPSYTITSFNIEKDDTYSTPYDDFEHIDIGFLHSSIQRIPLGLYKFLTEPSTR
jgi:Peptidase family M28